MSEDTALKSPSQLLARDEEHEPEPYEKDPMARRETLELVRAYYKISDPQLRRRLFDMTKALAKGEDNL